MQNRSLFYAQSQPRSFDWNSTVKDAMLGDAYLAQDLLGSTATVVSASLTATATGTLGITMGAGRVYELAAADATSVANGDLPADPTQILQQGGTGSQSLVLSTSALAAGQNQWVLIEAGFEQADAIRALDPSNGILNFFNSANWSQPLVGPGGNNQALPTVRQALCNLKLVYGNPATSGSEVPPQPDTGYAALYLVDLAYGQTVVNQGNILTAGPSVGVNVPSNYPGAPILKGLLNSHHGGIAGQAPKIMLASEVSGNLPKTSLPLLAAVTYTGASRIFVAGDHWTLALRSNSGTLMTDTLPGTSPGVLPSGSLVSVANNDGSALYVVLVGSGATLDGVAGGFVILGPDQRAQILSDGSNYWTIQKPTRARLGAATNFYVNGSTGNDANSGLASGTPWATLQNAYNWLQQNIDLGSTAAATVNVAAASYASLDAAGPILGQQAYGSVVFSFAAGAAIAGSGIAAIQANSGAGISIGGTVSISATGGAGFGIASSGATLALSGAAITIGACAGGGLYANSQGRILVPAGLTANGNCPTLFDAAQLGLIQLQGGTVTLSGSPVFASATASAVDGGIIQCPNGSVTMSGSAGSATPRYNANSGGIIDTGGGGANYFPGTSAGSTNGGSGQYL